MRCSGEVSKMTVWQISDISVEECAEGTVSASFVSEGEELNGIEDNNFENFEDNAKYTSIGDYYGKKADFYAKISVGALAAAAFCVMGVGSVLNFLESSGLIRTDIGWMYSVFGVLSIICYFVSLGFAVKGYRVKKTRFSKMMFWADLLIPLYFFIGTLAFLFIFWGFFGIFITGGASFWEFLMELFF